MNSLLFITLAAFALLALIVIVLIKTTRLRLWQGLLIFLLPLIMANLLWFSWVAPHQLQASQHEQAVNQLAKMPGYRVLQTQEPALWLLLTQELTRRIRAGEPALQATGELRGWLIEVVVLENSGPVAMPWLDQVGAVLETWYPGGDGGKAIANLLSGKVNPSGRLPVSWPSDLSQLPRKDLPGVSGGTPPESVDYAIEGANVGYRWYQSKGIKPLFPFGYGLSYTQFKHGDLKVDAKGTQLRATVDVTNTGSRAGADVAQVYVRVPGAKSARLAGYAKVFLKPGEDRTLSIPLRTSEAINMAVGGIR